MCINFSFFNNHDWYWLKVFIVDHTDKLNSSILYLAVVSHRGVMTESVGVCVEYKLSLLLLHRIGVFQKILSFQDHVEIFVLITASIN